MARLADIRVEKIGTAPVFFNFCIASGWIAANPAKILQNPIFTNPPTLPFTDAEVQRILQCATGKWRVLILVLLHSGLRIGDAMQLAPEKIQEGRLFLYTQKTNVPVRVPLPDFVLHDLGKLPINGGYYFWRREPRSKEATASGNARRALRKIFKPRRSPKGIPTNSATRSRCGSSKPVFRFRMSRFFWDTQASRLPRSTMPRGWRNARRDSTSWCSEPGRCR